jgi:hypothetical protein
MSKEIRPVALSCGIIIHHSVDIQIHIANTIKEILEKTIPLE